MGLLSEAREEIKKNLPDVLKTVPWYLRWIATARFTGFYLSLSKRR